MAETKYTTVRRGSNMPNCPRCNGGNALLDSWDFGLQGKVHTCRDCGFTCADKDLTIIQTYWNAVERAYKPI